jgi:hypothetical protein
LATGNGDGDGNGDSYRPSGQHRTNKTRHKVQGEGRARDKRLTKVPESFGGCQCFAAGKVEQPELGL